MLAFPTPYRSLRRMNIFCYLAPSRRMSKKYTELQVQSSFLCGQRKGSGDRCQQNDQTETWGRGARGRTSEGPKPRPPPGQARGEPTQPSGSRRRRRRAASPPCRAALTSAGCRPPRARRRSTGRGGRLGRFRAVSRRRATSRASPCPQAQCPGRRAAHVALAAALASGGDGGVRRGSERPVACSKAAMAAS